MRTILILGQEQISNEINLHAEKFKKIFARI